MSIRLRLTLAYTSVLAAVLVILGAALYYLLTFALLTSIDRQLESTADRVAESVQVRMSFFYLEKLLEIPQLDALATPGLFIQVYDSAAQQVIGSETLSDVRLPLNRGLVASVLEGQSDLRTVEVGDSKLRLYSAPLVVEGQVAGIVQVATTIGQVDETQRQLLIVLTAAGLVAIALSAGLGALLARAALRPIDKITQTALAISRTEDLSRRLEEGGPADEIGRLTATFNEMLSRLETLFRTQQRFIADVSHELRTPLTTIQGNVDLLRRGVAENAQARNETLAAIEGETARMSRLVDDLLLLARVDAGVRLELAPVELDTLLLEVYRQARLVGDGVEVRLGHEDQAVVLGDIDRLKQLFLNLVGNALKYTPPGGRVTLSLYNEEEWVRISVTDNGIGIPAEDLEPGPNGLPSIFERFYRADPARSRAMGGTGLGLSIVQWIVQAHGGQISVESQVGEGSTFTVRLPAQT